MATPAALPGLSSQLCDHCHQKPKFGTHGYCSKTCANQAALLCNHCHKKQKFKNFDYCGKNCAALANTNAKPRNAPNQTTAPPHVNPKQPHSNGANTNPQTVNAVPAFDPVQLAKLVAQHIPQTVIAPQGVTPHYGVPSIQSAPVVPVSGNVLPPNHPSNNPFLTPVNQTVPLGQSGLFSGTVPMASNPIPAAQQAQYNAQPASIHVTCFLPGCKQPVYVDGNGAQNSNYCSLRHGEEAVTSGLARPCILCLSLPQSSKDYFCSRGCREEALDKQLEYTAYDDGSDSE